jgi:ribosomal RNA-processing protein 8
MFAVEGWKLGPVVAQTNPKKRKRDDDAATIRRNPFSLNPKNSKEKPREKPHEKPAQAETNVPTISKRQIARNKAAKRLQRKLENPEPKIEPEIAEPLPTLTPLQQKMRAKLTGSQFRHINEKLYTTNSSEALHLFTEQPALFDFYHQGFRHQVQSWPTNPIDKFIALIPKKRSVIADLGCGDAAIARHFRASKVKVRSFDLAKVNEFVEVCDMAHVPLKDGSVDIAVFCLSLMGTNFLAFIREACRFTKLGYIFDDADVVAGYGLQRLNHDLWMRRSRVLSRGWRGWD